MFDRPTTWQLAVSRIWPCCLSALVLSFLILDASVAQQPRATYRMGMFVPVDRIETELKRGISTKADVERVLEYQRTNSPVTKIVLYAGIGIKAQELDFACQPKAF